MDVFDYATTNIDTEVLYQDLDNVDLYGEKMNESESESDIQFE